MRPALVLLELESIAVGIATGDAMAKRAPLATLRAGTVHPGRYLVLAGGEVGAVEEARMAGRSAAGESLRDEVFLPDVHPDVVRALAGRRDVESEEALGILETAAVPSLLAAADAAVKGARVRLLEIRLADGLGGKAYALFAGPVAEVEAGLELGVGAVRDAGRLVARVVIPRIHEEMLANLAAHGEFGPRVRGEEG